MKINPNYVPLKAKKELHTNTDPKLTCVTNINVSKTHENTTQHERSDIVFTLVIQASDSAENQSWNSVSAFLRSFSVGFDSDEWTTQVALGQQSLAEHELSKENYDMLVELINVAQSRDHTERMLASDWLFAVSPFEL